MSVEAPKSVRGMLVVVAAAAFVAVIFGWSELMFEFPSWLFATEPTAWWFVAGSAICTAAAFAVFRSRWAAVIALPAAGMFAAWCAVLFASRVKPVDEWLPAPPFDYGLAALGVFCALLPLAVVTAAVFWRLGLGGKTCITIAVVLCLGPFLVATGVNLADYATFRLAWHRVMTLSNAQLAALIRKCGGVKEHQRLRGGNWPAQFAPHHPQFVSLSPGFTYASLYSRGQVYVELAVRTEGAGSVVYVYTNIDGPQKTLVLWTTAPHTQSAEPLVTLSTYGMHPGPRWIVLPDRVRAEGRSDDGTPIVAQAPLTQADREAIQHAAAEVKRRIGGRAFEAPVADGLGMVIHFGRAGVPSSDDIILHNAWVEQAGPLIRAVARVAPTAAPLDFEQRLKLMFADVPKMVIRVRTTAEIRDEHPQLPWWCFWRKLVGRQVTDADAIVGTTNIPDPYRYVDR